MRQWLVVAALLAGPAWAQDEAQTAAAYPRVVAIEYSGNEVTREAVLRRELVIAVGDPADPERIERSRQGLLDLGLFSAAGVEQQPVDGGVRLVFAVKERYYLLPTPRFDAKSDGRYSYGAQLIWNNVGGRNHTLRVYAERENAEREGIGTETQYAVRYYAPFAFDSRYNLTVSSSYAQRPVRREEVNFEESFRNASFSVSRTFSDGAASQGLTVGGGLGFRQQRTSGPEALPAYGSAIVPTAFVNYRDFHNRIYSDVGEITSLAVSVADENLGSDYSFVATDLGLVRQYAVGVTEHQTLHLRAYAGAYFSGPDEVEAYGLGGASNLRGYEVNFLEGNAYYYAAVEFARPLWRPWLRAVVIAEIGNVFVRPEDADFDKVYGSIGVGLRLRVPQFVGLELEIGYALPLDGDGGRVFAGGL